MHVVHKNEHEYDAVSWEAAVSSWIDGEGEIRAEELDTPYGRQVWDTYHLIGDVLRTEDLAIKPSDMFYARLSRAIDDELAIVAPRPWLHGGWRLGMSVVAATAIVTVAAWVALPGMLGVEPDVQTSPVSAQLASAVTASPDDDIALHDYFDAHQGLVGVVPVRQVSYEGSR